MENPSQASLMSRFSKKIVVFFLIIQFVASDHLDTTKIAPHLAQNLLPFSSAYTSWDTITYARDLSRLRAENRRSPRCPNLDR